VDIEEIYKEFVEYLKKYEDADYPFHHMTGIDQRNLFNNSVLEDEGALDAVECLNSFAQEIVLSNEDVLKIMQISQYYDNKHMIRNELHKSIKFIDALSKDTAKQNEKLDYLKDYKNEIFPVLKEYGFSKSNRRKIINEAKQSNKRLIMFVDEFKKHLTSLKTDRKKSTSEYKYDFIIWAIFSVYYKRYKKYPVIPILDSIWSVDDELNQEKIVKRHKALNLIIILFNNLGQDSNEKNIQSLLWRMNKVRRWMKKTENK